MMSETQIYDELCYVRGWESHRRPFLSLGKIMSYHQRMHVGITRLLQSVIDEDGWDRTPGQDPREVGLPEGEEDE